MTAAHLDTNILVGFFKGEDAVKAALERYDALKIPAAAYAEFMVGLHAEAQRQAANKVIEALFEIVHTSNEICQAAAAMRRNLRLKLPDAMIYATAKIDGGVLLTRDLDFDEFWGGIERP